MHLDKILFVHQGFELYGSDRSFLSFCHKQSLFDRKYTDIVLSREGDLSDILKESYNVSYLGMGRLPMHIVKKKPFRFIVILARDVCKAVIVLRRYKIVYINTIAPLAWLIASALLKKRRIVHVREIPSKSVALVLSLFMFANCKIVFNSSSTMKNFRSVFRLNSVVVNNGVESLSRRVDKSTDYTSIFKDGFFNVLVPGRINSWKGQDFVLNCISKYSSAFEGVNWVFAGDVAINQDWRYDKLKEIIDYDAIDTINFIGWRQDLANLMFYSDLVVVPSIMPEPFGRVVIEAMSIGKLVLASNHGGPSEIIKNNKNGFLFDPVDEESFRDNLISIKELSLEEKQRIEGEAILEFEQKYSESIYLNNLSNELKKHFFGSDKAAKK